MMQEHGGVHTPDSNDRGRRHIPIKEFSSGALDHLRNWKVIPELEGGGMWFLEPLRLRERYAINVTIDFRNPRREIIFECSQKREGIRYIITYINFRDPEAFSIESGEDPLTFYLGARDTGPRFEISDKYVFVVLPGVTELLIVEEVSTPERS